MIQAAIRNDLKESGDKNDRQLYPQNTASFPYVTKRMLEFLRLVKLLAVFELLLG
jgi:hypothetical protein